MQHLILDALKNGGPRYFVSSAHPRIVDGQPSKNPRYLQKRPDLVNARDVYAAEMATRLQRRISLDTPLYTPVNVVVPGRRNNPPDPVARIRSLAVFNPVHYMELPELFMEFISSMTGKSPSTTGAGSEGALTKGPFNALPPIIDLNAALVSFALTDYDAFISSAGHLGPKVRVDHDISLLIPEVWCRMTAAERQPAFLIDNGYFEKCEDFDFNGCKVQASRLGYRMTASFVRTFFGRVFSYPFAVFTDEMLRPEQQDMAVFADGVDNIVGTHKRVAESYFADGSIEMACPPLKAVLHIMARGSYEGRDVNHPGFSRALQSGQCPGQRLVRPAPGSQAAARHQALATSRDVSGKFSQEEELRRGSDTPGHRDQIGIGLGHLPQSQGRRIPGHSARHHWLQPLDK